jgi:hypothetical protein
VTAKLVKRRLYTVSTADRTLPLVRAIVKDVVQLHGELSERERQLEEIRRSRKKKRQQATPDPYEEEIDDIQKTLDAESERYGELVAELDQLGIEFRDPSQGLVDFPSVVGGKEAFLSWSLGEERVQTWHPASTDYSERRPIDRDEQLVSEETDEA